MATSLAVRTFTKKAAVLNVDVSGDQDCCENDFPRNNPRVLLQGVNVRALERSRLVEGLKRADIQMPAGTLPAYHVDLGWVRGPRGSRNVVKLPACKV